MRALVQLWQMTLEYSRARSYHKLSELTSILTNLLEWFVNKSTGKSYTQIVIAADWQDRAVLSILLYSLFTISRLSAFSCRSVERYKTFICKMIINEWSCQCFVIFNSSPDQLLILLHNVSNHSNSLMNAFPITICNLTFLYVFTLI